MMAANTAPAKSLHFLTNKQIYLKLMVNVRAIHYLSVNRGCFRISLIDGLGEKLRGAKS
jgi:hypothetical protein